MIFQGFAAGVAETAEVFMQRMLTLAEAVVQGTQDFLLGLGGDRPVDQRLLLQGAQLIGQAGGVDGGAQRAFTEDGARRGVQAVENSRLDGE